MIRRLYLLLIIAIGSISLGFSQGYSIETNIKGQTDTVAYLGHHFATQRYVDDTTKVESGKAVFDGNKTLTEGIYFYYSPQVYFEFIIEDQNFSIEGDATDVVGTAVIKGSPENEAFYRMQRFNYEKRIASEELRASIDSTASLEEKQMVNEKLNAIQDEIKAYQKKLQTDYPNSLLDRLIRLMQTPEIPPVPAGEDSVRFRYEYYKNHFWDGISIADPGLLRSPLLHNKIMDYLDNVVIQQADTVINEVEKLIQIAKKNDEAYRYLLISLTNKYESSPIMGFDKVFVYLVDNYYLTNQAPWTDAATIKKLEERAASIRPNFIGNPAPPFVLQDSIGTNYDLYGVNAKYTVLYFYDPDCGHCKKSTPLLYEAYAELQTKSVEVLAICTTTDGKRWKEFINEFDLNWINLADLNSRTNVKYYYDVRSTPTVYILDQDKKILLKKVATEDVPEIIDQLIAAEVLK
jgi:peroxiredoxin